MRRRMMKTTVGGPCVISSGKVEPGIRHLIKLSGRDVEEKRPKNSKWIKEEIIIIITKSPTEPPETPG